MSYDINNSNITQPFNTSTFRGVDCHHIVYDMFIASSAFSLLQGVVFVYLTI